MSSNGKFAEGFCNYNDNHLVLCGRLRVVSNFGERQTSKQDKRAHERVLEDTRREGKHRKFTSRVSSESRVNRVFYPTSCFRQNWGYSQSVLRGKKSALASLINILVSSGGLRNDVLFYYSNYLSSLLFQRETE